jgi:hypothetical protein
MVNSACGEGPKTYYLSSSTGDDQNNGLSENKPWKTLDKINSFVFSPGDRLYIQAGTTYSGQLNPNGSGTAEAPILVDMYGKGEKPLIAAEGKYSEALLIENQEFWELSNLQLTNFGPTREELRYGIRLRSWDFGTMHHIHLRNLHVHDVNGSLVKRDPGEGHGITWQIGGDKKMSRFDDLLIEDCILERTDRNGMCGYSGYPSGRGEEWFPSLNVVIRRNKLLDIGGDAIKIWSCDGAIVEYNVVQGARQRCDDYAAGIWPWNCDNTVIQFNEVSGVKGTKDGQSFDTDGYCYNTIFQYNYSHDNDGGFMLMCGDNSDTVIRYNISQNDKQRLFHMAGRTRDVQIYNNLFYVGKDIDAYLFLWTVEGSVWPTNVFIQNNIFYLDGLGRNRFGLRRKQGEANDGTYITEPGLGETENIVFEANILNGNFEDIPEAWRAMINNPKLVNPGKGANGFESLEGYKLEPGSPAIGAGVVLPENGGRDFWGNKLTAGNNPSIGVHEPQ